MNSINNMAPLIVFRTLFSLLVIFTLSSYLSARETRVLNTAFDYPLTSKQQTGLVDVIVYSQWAGLGYFERNKIQQVRMQMPALASRRGYGYSHKKQSVLVPRLAKSIQAMKQDRSYDRIFNKILKPITSVK